MTARKYGLSVLGATLLAGCWPSFPENLLRVDAAVNDLGEVDAGDNDAAVDATVSETGADVPVDRGTSDGPPGDALDAGADDAGDGGGDTDASDAAADSATDAGRDVYTFPPDADVCAMFPLPDGVPNARVLSDLDGAIDLAFDPNGRVAVAFPDRVVLYGPGSASTPVVSSLVGEPVAVRYTRQGTLVVAYNVVATPDAGVSDGGAPDAAALDGSTDGGADAGPSFVGRIGVLVAGGSSLTDLPLTDTGRIGGLAIDREDRIWYTESTRGRLMRVQPNGTMRTQVYAFPCGMSAPVPVCTPGLLAFGPGERSLFVSSASSVRQLVVRLALTVPDAGPATIPSGTQPTSVLDGFSSISGLATDECSNVYVTDTSRMDIVRVTATGEGLTVLTRGVMAPRSLAFGAGMGFDERSLFFLAGEPRGLWETLAIARGAARAGTPMSP